MESGLRLCTLETESHLLHQHFPVLPHPHPEMTHEAPEKQGPPGTGQLDRLHRGTGPATSRMAGGGPGGRAWPSPNSPPHPHPDPREKTQPAERAPEWVCLKPAPGGKAEFQEGLPASSLPSSWLTPTC